MPEFRKKLTAREIEKGAICWEASQDADVKSVIPASLVFNMMLGEQEIANLSVEWEKRSLFVGEAIATAAIDSEIVLSNSRERGSVVNCQIFAPQEKMAIRKRLSHQEHSGRYLKWFAREDELYTRMFSLTEGFEIEIGGKRMKGRAPDFEKRKLMIGDLLRVFSPGDDLLIKWKTQEIPVLLIKRDDPSEKAQLDGTTPLRSLITRLLARPLGEFNEGEVKGLIVLLEENKKLWERIVTMQEENRRLKEQVNMIESLFEQFTSNSFFNSKKEFELWVAAHINMFEKGLRVIHRNYSVTLSNERKRRIDLLCQDRKGVLVVVQILYSPEPVQINEALDLLEHLRANTSSFGSELTSGQFKSADLRGMIIANYERTDLVEHCLQKQVKLCLVKSGCLIDVLE
ncbi:MAG TPA: endonuclease NucS [Candidatus Rifleibacterium sp.]|jgi:hypothetical protein|nr:endonuclease NucS [Candidatus Rifleibacterium sp.]HNW11170.1 endonuclease NucS [Candidatus Rifleibacterium sp.]HOI91615.1 endonuclease NucS [Candidatus Rifleibacterium sp.]HPW57911.1 endonuclease NucS [Candidatus Rifleibacterium sp.]